MKRVLVWCTLLAMVLGCSYAKIEKVTDETDHGLRFYRPHPYVLLYEKDNSKYVAEIVWLPDKSEEYVIRPRMWFSKLEYEATLEHGWNLTLFKNKGEAIPLKEIPEALDQLIKITLDSARTQKFEAMRPRLFRMVFDSTGGYVDHFVEVKLPN